jgi:hypothetical protein
MMVNQTGMASPSFRFATLPCAHYRTATSVHHASFPIWLDCLFALAAKRLHGAVPWTPFALFLTSFHRTASVVTHLHISTCQHALLTFTKYRPGPSGDNVPSTLSGDILIMATDAYLQIDGIKGESMDSAHQGWIELTLAHWGVVQPRSSRVSASGGHTAGHCEHRTLSLTKLADLASPTLMQH